jgi:hypothetical protein
MLDLNPGAILVQMLREWAPFSPEARARRKAKRANRKARRAARRGELTSEFIELEPTEGNGMGNYSKAIGAIVGGIIGIVVIKVPFLAPLLTDALVQQIVVAITGLVGTFFAPANKAT